MVAGLLGGLAFLCDYSGALYMGLIGFYAWWRAADDKGLAGGFRDSLWYLAGAIPGILILFQYQYASFGNAILPPQNWMAPVEFIDVGYKGVGGFSPELFRLLLIDSRFGLFVAMPLASPLIELAPHWHVGEPVALLLCLLPALHFARMTETDRDPLARTRYHAFGWGGYLLLVLPSVYRPIRPHGQENSSCQCVHFHSWPR